MLKKPLSLNFSRTFLSKLGRARGGYAPEHQAFCPLSGLLDAPPLAGPPIILSLSPWVFLSMVHSLGGSVYVPNPESNVLALLCAVWRA